MTQSRALLAISVVIALAGALSVAVTGCGGGGGGNHSSASPGHQDALTFERLSRRVRWRPPPAGKGETEIVVQFAVRDATGRAYGADEVEVEMQIDERPLDPEAVLERSSSLLESNIRYALVLDASASMLIPDKQPFTQMRTAAADSVTALLKAWEGNSGAVAWTFLWFSDVLNRPFGGPLEPAHIEQIPEPQPGDFTKLYAAVHEMALAMKNEHDRELFAAGELDSHVLVVLSDGQDNHSYQDNTALRPARGVLGGGVYYQTFGYRPVEMADVTRVIASHPRLTVHAIGLGNRINVDELRKLVTAERGGKLLTGSVLDLPELFAAVTREFATVQTHGARVPLKPGDYTFRCEVISKADPRHRGSFVFAFHTGDGDAGVRPRAPAFLDRPPETVVVGDWYRHGVDVDAHPGAAVRLWGAPPWLQLDDAGRMLVGLPDEADLGRSPVMTLEATNSEPPAAEHRFSVDVHLPWTADPSGVTGDLGAVWGAEGVGFFAAGSGGTILERPAAAAVWRPMGPVPTANNLGSLAGVWRDQNQTRTLAALYAAGGGDFLRYLPGRGWEKLLTGYPQCFADVWAAAEDSVFAVGKGGAVLHFDGTRWAFLDPGTRTDLNRIWGATPTGVYVTGAGGLVLHHDGLAWHEMVSGTIADLFGIWGLSSRTLLAVGRGGTILQHEDNRWQPMNSGTVEDLWDVWGTAADDVFAVGDQGTLLHFNGAVWKKMDSRTTRDLCGVWGADSRHVYVVGRGGAILRYGRD
ncbi:MAG: hypothetical protein JXQ29_17185 [Planctomycetes bacterium]|nr:hypothetical protein [Planctomycetota bacterium]